MKGRVCATRRCPVWCSSRSLCLNENVSVWNVVAVCKGEGHHSATTACTLWLRDAPQTPLGWECDQYHINVSPHTQSIVCLFSTVWQLIRHGSRLETRWSDLCQDEGLSTLACKSESGPLTDRHTVHDSHSASLYDTDVVSVALIFFLPLLHFLLDWWSPRRCCETIQHQISHLLFRHSRNVSGWPRHYYFNAVWRATIPKDEILFSQPLMWW